MITWLESQKKKRGTLCLEENFMTAEKKEKADVCSESGLENLQP